MRGRYRAGMELAWVLDCADPDRLADFWASALGFRAGRRGGVYVAVTDPSGRWPEMLLQRVPEPKRVKNRMHLDLRVHRHELEPEVARLEALGAHRVRGPFNDEGWLTTVLTDPEDNEFCAIVPPSGPAE